MHPLDNTKKALPRKQGNQWRAKPLRSGHAAPAKRKAGRAPIQKEICKNKDYYERKTGTGVKKWMKKRPPPQEGNYYDRQIYYAQIIAGRMPSHRGKTDNWL